MEVVDQHSNTEEAVGAEGRRGGYPLARRCGLLVLRMQGETPERCASGVVSATEQSVAVGGKDRHGLLLECDTAADITKLADAKQVVLKQQH